MVLSSSSFTAIVIVIRMKKDEGMKMQGNRWRRVESSWKGHRPNGQGRDKGWCERVETEAVVKRKMGRMERQHERDPQANKSMGRKETMFRTQRGYLPIPISIWPIAISPAIWLTAVNPLEHWRLTVLIAVVFGIPAARAAIRAAEAPPAGGRTFPTAISSMREGSRLIFVYAARRTPDRISSGRVSLKPPFLAFVMAERTAQTMTTSSSFLESTLDFAEDMVVAGSKCW